MTKNKLDSHLGYKVRFSSPLMRRILLVNALPLVVLVATLLYLNQFQNSLLETEVTALREQAKIYAGALGQSAIKKIGDKLVATEPRQVVILGGNKLDAQSLSIELARPLLLSLTGPSPSVRARVYAPDGRLVVDSRAAARQFGKSNHRYNHNKKITRADKSPPSSSESEEEEQLISTPYDTALEQIYTHLLSWIPYTGERKIKYLDVNADPDSLPHERQRLEFSGNSNNQEIQPYIRRTIDHHLFITVSEPIINRGQTIGIIQLTREARNIDSALFAVRSSILMLFLLALIITVLLSWYLSLTIARPLLRLANAAHEMREAVGRIGMVPDHLLTRKDEIGEVARALQDSSKALWARMDAIECFSADVSHELKNPLSSIRSAVELLPRVTDPERRARLLFVVTDDVRRLDRLIIDIASSSRIEAEMSRITPRPVSVVPIFQLLAEMSEATHKGNDPHLIVDVDESASPYPLKVFAVEDRLVQVLRNLIGNASSFSPPNGQIILSAVVSKDKVDLMVSDQGRGVPENKLDSIFERFYTERPQGENFGQHSGLGLSICRQIIIALKGSIKAYNRYDASGKVIGACFIITLPRAT